MHGFSNKKSILFLKKKMQEMHGFSKRNLNGNTWFLKEKIKKKCIILCVLHTSEIRPSLYKGQNKMAAFLTRLHCERLHSKKTPLQNAQKNFVIFYAQSSPFIVYTRMISAMGLGYEYH